MTATLQPLPPWMTYVDYSVTLPDGEVATSYSILELPLTYYGPSIPLGPDWVYGGLTSPAATPTSTTAPATTTPPPGTTHTSSATPSSPPATVTVTATPTSHPASTSSHSTSGTITPPPAPTSSATSTSSPVISSSSTTSPASTPTASSGAAHNTGLSRTSTIAIITGAIAGFLILLVLLLLILLLRRRRNARGRTRVSPGSSWIAGRSTGAPVGAAAGAWQEASASLSSMLSRLSRSLAGGSYVELVDEDGLLAGTMRGVRSSAGQLNPARPGPRWATSSGAAGPIPREKAPYDEKAAAAAELARRTSQNIIALGPDGREQLIRRSGADAADAADPDELSLLDRAARAEDAVARGADYERAPGDVVDAYTLAAFQRADAARVHAAAMRAAQMYQPGADAAYATVGQSFGADGKRFGADEQGFHADGRETSSPLLPPRALDPDGLGLTGLGLYAPRRTGLLGVSPLTTGSRPSVDRDSGVSLLDAQHPPEVLTARRVVVSDPAVPPASASSASSAGSPDSPTVRGPGSLAPTVAGSPPPTVRIVQPSPNTRAAPAPATAPARGSWNPLPALPAGLARLSGLSAFALGRRAPGTPPPNTAVTPWLARSVSSRPGSRLASRSSYPTRPSTGDEDEGLGLLAPGATTPPLSPPASPPQPPAAAALPPLLIAEERPLSALSGESGASGFFTARETPAATPVSSQNSREGAARAAAAAPAVAPPVPVLPAGAPPAYAPRDPAFAALAASRRGPGHTRAASSLGSLDLLDLPAPRALSTFAGRARAPAPLLPPGLGLPTPRAWADAASSAGTPSPGSGSGTASPRVRADADALDVPVPRAADVWRELADGQQRGVRAGARRPALVAAPARTSAYGSVHTAGSGSPPVSRPSSRAEVLPPPLSAVGAPSFRAMQRGLGSPLRSGGAGGRDAGFDQESR